MKIYSKLTLDTYSEDSFLVMKIPAKKSRFNEYHLLRIPRFNSKNFQIASAKRK